MATPMTASSLVAALRRWGLTVVEHVGWPTNNRNSVGAWGPVNGTMVHHTASADGPGIVELCFSGRSDLPGPLCAGVIRKNGTVHLVGNGRTNHAGAGSSAVLSAVINETAIPSPPGPDAVDGNTRFYGWEAVNLGDGVDPWPAAQLEAIARVQAAICEYHGWGAGSVIGHKEWTARKIDPRGFSMVTMRSRVAAHLSAGPTPMEDDVALTTDEIEKIARKVLTLDEITAPKDTPDAATNPTWRLDSYVKDIDARIRAVQAALASPSPVTLTDAQVAAIADSPDLAEAIAELVAAKLAARLAT